MASVAWHLEENDPMKVSGGETSTSAFSARFSVAGLTLGPRPYLARPSKPQLHLRPPDVPFVPGVGVATEAKDSHQ